MSVHSFKDFEKDYEGKMRSGKEEGNSVFLFFAQGKSFGVHMQEGLLIFHSAQTYILALLVRRHKVITFFPSTVI